mmetsp:Transcript_37253/g.98154  ORF Transcript_37253/g.98154 Transcript_37253/m.98154 type:complete len:472 (-) Transcript_37253:98-1513(-)
MATSAFAVVAPGGSAAAPVPPPQGLLPAKVPAAALGVAAAARTTSSTPVPTPTPQPSLVTGAALGVAGGAAVARRRRQRRCHQRGPRRAAVDVAEAPAPGAALDEGASAASDGAAAAAAASATASAPLTCPVCQQQKLEILRGAVGSASEVGARCEACGIDFPVEPDGGFIDLTIGASAPAGELPVRDTAASAAAAEADDNEAKPQRWLSRLPFVGATDAVAKQLGLPQSEEVEALGVELLRDPSRWLGRSDQPFGTSTFQNPFVSFAYERGWRRQFAASGFPGIDEEFRMAQEFLADGYRHDSNDDGATTLLDASCGSGLFSRRFASSGRYGSVVALDFSAAMLRQVDDFAARELDPVDRGRLRLVRADIARLPFATGALGGVHAGAAIHCWPSPENAVAEVARVLRPGGVFVLSTFRPGGQMLRGFKFWTEEELRTLTRQCGLVDFKAVKRAPAFIMVSVKKPEAPPEQ